MSLVRITPWNWFLNEPVRQRRMLPAHERQMANAPVTRLHDDIDTLFDQAVRGFFTPSDASAKDVMFVPNLDLHTDEKQYTASMEIPGVAPDQIKLSLQDDLLVISGEKKCETSTEDKDKGYSRRERVFGTFERTLTLPDDADAEHITADSKHGVLTICIPRKAPVKNAARQIAVTHAE